MKVDRDIMLCVEQPMSYYSTMEAESKTEVQEHWNTNSDSLGQLLMEKPELVDGKSSVRHVQIMIATAASGTGIDSPCVRAVIHVGFCRSLLDYSQEIGRAGRDGFAARCLLVYNEGFPRTFASSVSMEIQDSVREVSNGSLQSFETRHAARQKESDMAFPISCHG